MQTSDNQAAMTAMTWVVVADDRRARVLLMLGPRTPLQEQDLIKRVETGALISVLRSLDRGDAPNRSGQGRTFVVTEPRADGFSRAISAYLDYHRSCGQLGRLILVAPPEMLSMLDRTLTPALRKSLELEMEADLVGDPAAAIQARLPHVG
jgi:protein required for attachment to host cells